MPEDSAWIGFAPVEMTTPFGDGYMPLSCAVQWVLTKGNSPKLAEIGDAAWMPGYKEVVTAIASGEVEAVGFRRGEMETIPASQFSVCHIHLPFVPNEDEHRQRDAIVLRSYYYLTEEEWRDGLDDALISDDEIKWKQIMLLKRDVAKKWPFQANASVAKTGAPGRPSPMHLITAEHEARWDRGEAHKSVRAEAKSLLKWFSRVHVSQPPPSSKTIENRIRETHRGRRGRDPKL
jgi:hypothetical protein